MLQFLMSEYCFIFLMLEGCIVEELLGLDLNKFQSSCNGSQCLDSVQNKMV